MRPQTEMAVEAFEAVERAELLVARKRKELEKYHVPAEDMAEYYAVTEGIRKKYAEKAEKAGV